MKPSGITLTSQSGETRRARGERRRGWLKLLPVLLVSGLSLWLAMRNVDASLMLQEMRSAQPSFLVLAVLISAIASVVRTVRWKVLLAYAPAATLRSLYTSMMIGYMANNILPARMGELVRIHVLARKTGVKRSLSAATIILERITDALVLLAVVGLASFFLPLPISIRRGSQIAAAVFVAAIILLLVLARGDTSSLQSGAQKLGRFSPSLGQKVKEALKHFVDGLSILRNGKQALVVLGLTLMNWGIEAVSLAFVMKSLDLSLPRLAPLFLLAVLSLSFVIPAAPGAVGTYEFFAIIGLSAFAVDRSQAAGLAVLLHAIVYVTSISLGFACLIVERLSVRELWTTKLVRERLN
jgi:uncharacterized protein (TIRG00374 family)